ENAEPRLSPAEQYNVGDNYISGWFRLTMGGEEEFLPMYDGTGAVPASVGRAQVYTVAQQPSSQRLDVATFMEPSSRVRPAGDATVTYCASLSGRPYPQQFPACADSDEITSSQAPHWTPMRFAPSAPAGEMAVLEWTAENGGLRVDVPAGVRDVSGFDNLTFRAAPTVDGAADLTVTVVDGSGRSASTVVSEVSDALTPMPGTESPLNKTYLRMVQIPVADLQGVDTTDVRQVRLTGVGESGGAYLSDLSFSSPGVGTANTLDLPNLYVSDATVNEGQGPSSAKIALQLDEPADTVVSAYVEANGGESGAQRLAAPLTIVPGQTCAVFDVPVEGDRLTATEATTDVTVTAAAVTGASSADTFGRLTIREDDA
ncbi:hypothetical protein PU560_02515, partial [Georgenia sp. 10Sc9-8]|nr:hypothetical protein [Georgenia halotolerans]